MKNYVKEHPYLVLGLLFLAANQLLAVTDSAESNYALTAKEMIQSGDWLSPQIYGHYWYDKPIFYYWELDLSFRLFGINEWAARFPAAVTGILNTQYMVCLLVCLPCVWAQSGVRFGADSGHVPGILGSV